MISLYLSFRHRGPSDARLSAAEHQRIAAILRAMPGIETALIFTPAVTTDPYLDDGPPPILAVQIRLATASPLDIAEAAGPLGRLASPDAFPGLAGAEITSETMATRVFPVPDAQLRTAPGAPSCSYLVAYEGIAEDPGAWVDHYIAHHVPIMARLPGIRRIEVGTRLDWQGALPGRRVDHLLRNRVVFDDAAALTQALASPVRHEMRADFHNFPSFEGRVTHHPCATWAVVPAQTHRPY